MALLTQAVKPGALAMDRTNAERQRRYIARLKAQAKAGGDGDKLGVSNERIAELEQALAQAKRRAAMAESANTMLRRDLAQAERKLAKPKIERPPLPPD
jgi:hypothetical protein